MASKSKKRKSSVSSSPKPPLSSPTTAPATSIDFSPEVADSGPSSGHSERFFLGALAILVLGIVLRQLFLGPAPFHPDEAIHAHFSRSLISYVYDPVYHGPLLYHLVGAVFGLFGEYDYTARLVPSLLGVLLLWMILFPARAFLGNRAAIIAAALVAVSPSIVTYSRHLLHDSLVLVLTLGAVLCFATTLQKGAGERGGRAARIGLCAFAALFLATKANVFFILVMLATFWMAWRFAGRFRLPDDAASSIPPLCFGVVCLAAFAFPRDNSFPEALKNSQHTLFQLVAVGACAWMFLWLMTRKISAQELEFKRDWHKKTDLTTYLFALGAGLWIFIFLFGSWVPVLLQWATQGEFPAQKWSDGIASAQGAIGKMLEYWGGQQGKPRLPGRHDYYIVLGLLYELPLYLAALGGIWNAAKNRSAFTDLLLWWAFTSWAVYSVANEKVPWLLVHIALPLALLSAVWLAKIRWKKPVLAICATLGLAFALRSNSAFIFERAGDNAEPLLYAQTPDEFRDAFLGALEKTQGRSGAVWLENERQWPTFWYYRDKNNPLRGDSGLAIGGTPDFASLRVAVGQEKNRAELEKANMDIKEANFLIWNRPSWSAISPVRYGRWFFTRETVPSAERDKPQNQWELSILAGKGEWSHARALVGTPKN